MHRRPIHWQEARRLQAWHLKQKGWSQRRMADALGVSAGAVSQWVTRARTAGPDALRHRSPPGAPSRLTAEPLARWPDLLHQGPTAYGFRGDLWPRSRMAAVIRLACGVRYHPGPISRVCQAIRWSPQQPRRRARQRDEAARAPGRHGPWPALNKGRKPSSTLSA
jgi:transposase